MLPLLNISSEFSSADLFLFKVSYSYVNISTSSFYFSLSHYNHFYLTYLGTITALSSQTFLPHLPRYYHCSLISDIPTSPTYVLSLLSHLRHSYLTYLGTITALSSQTFLLHLPRYYHCSLISDIPTSPT